MTTRIITGDALTELAKLPAESVHCCVTSPPYYGLRDYGTATWEGGDPVCDHVAGMARQDTQRETPGGRGGSFRGGEVQFRSVCRCGARRIDAQLGLEPTPDEYVSAMVAVFRVLRRVLRADGTLWLNIGDSYAGSPSGSFDKGGRGSGPLQGGGFRANKAMDTGRLPGIKPKDLLGIPWMLAFALRADGWYLRQDIIWAKPNPMPESVTDRCTKAHEYLFLLSKSERYYFDAAAIAEPSDTGDLRRPYTSEGAWQLDGRPVEQRHGGQLRTAGNKTHKFVTEYEASDSEEHRTKAGLLKIADTAYPTRNKRSVWTIATAPFPEAHFATFPPALVEPCILAGTSAKGVCPSCGAPWVRATKTEYDNPGNRTTNGPRSLAQRHETAGFAVRLEKRVETTGWLPSCRCVVQSPPLPATVLDPFLGAGTTALVADRLGRNAIGFELNPAYAAMARRRIEDDAGLFFEAAQ